MHHSNMKELRFYMDNGVSRVAFSVDLELQVILLFAGNKQGKDQKQFHKRFIKKSGQRFDDWLNSLKMK